MGRNDTTEVELDLGELIELVSGAEAEDLFKDLPVQVVSYDPEKQAVDVQPVVLIVIDGTPQKLPILRQVQVQFPSGSGWSLTGPLEKDDDGWIVPAGADISGWKASGAANAEAQRHTRGSLSDVRFQPGSRPLSRALGALHYAADGPVLFGDPFVYLGDSSADKFVALGKLVHDELVALATHTHPPGTYTTPSGPVTGASGQASYSAPGSETDIQAAKVKAK